MKCRRMASVCSAAILVACLVASSFVAADEQPGSEIFPFLVLMHVRSGSTWFQSTHLAQHPDIYAELELCHQLGRETCPDRARQFNNRCLQRADARGSKPTWCGFKETVFNIDKVADELHRWEAGGGRWKNYRVIHLYRANVVKQVLSVRTAQATGRWQCRTKRCKKPHKAPALMADAIMSFLDAMLDKEANHTCEFLNRFSAEVLEISYEELMADEAAVVARVYDFLGVPQWSGWTAAREKSWNAKDPFAVLAPGEKERLREQLRWRYSWARLDAALDGDTGFEHLMACRRAASRPIGAPTGEGPDHTLQAAIGSSELPTNDLPEAVVDSTLGSIDFAIPELPDDAVFVGTRFVLLGGPLVLVMLMALRRCRRQTPANSRMVGRHNESCPSAAAA